MKKTELNTLIETIIRKVLNESIIVDDPEKVKQILDNSSDHHEVSISKDEYITKDNGIYKLHSGGFITQKQANFDDLWSRTDVAHSIAEKPAKANKPLIDNITSIDWWYPVFEGRERLNKLYKLVVRSKEAKERNFKTIKEFNDYYSLSSPSNTFIEFKNFIKDLNPVAKVYQSEFDIS